MKSPKFRIIKKNISILLIVSFILAFFSGCSLFKKTEIAGEKVSADTPWYECQITECAVDYDNDALFDYQVYQFPIGMTSDGYVFAIQTYDESVSVQLYLYSEKGEEIADIDLMSTVRKLDYDIDLDNINIPYNLYIKDNKLKLLCTNYDDMTILIFDVDILNGSVSLSGSYYFPQGLMSEWKRDVIGHYICGDYEIFVSLYEEFCILTVGPEGEVFYVSPDPATKQNLSGFVSDLVPISDTKVLFYDYQTMFYFIYDVAVGELYEATNEYDWFKPYFNLGSEGDIRHNVGDDGTLYFITYDAVAVPDFENGCFKDIALLENMDINRAIFASGADPINVYVLSASEDEVFFVFADVFPRKSECGFEFCKAVKAKSNPNAGKVIITTDGYWMDTVYDAVYRFNSVDEEYFIKIVPNKYESDRDSYYFDNASDTPELYIQGEVGNRMMVDLMAGDCPDVVFYASEYGQLNNANCMADLMPYYESSKMKEQVFDNIIRACEKDGGLYAFPLRFDLKGIIVDRSRYEFEGSGMTFDQFGKFTDTYCNGLNVISYQKTDFLNECLYYNYDLFERDGKIDFDCPEFRAMAEFTADNVYDVDWEIWHNTWFKNPIVSLETHIEGYLGWFGNVNESSCDIKNADLVGLPSGDGRGPSAEIVCSVSITKDSQVPEGAWRFIEMLLDPEIQVDLNKQVGSYQNSFPVNKEAFDTVGSNCIDIYNRQKMMEKGFQALETVDLNRIREIVDEVEHITITDTDIHIIVYEEIQVYFAGDKGLDDVITIMNDRAGTVINERE